MKKELIRNLAWEFFSPVLHELGRDRVEDRAHGFVEGYSKAIKDVQTILAQVGDLGDRDFISMAVDSLPEEFDGGV